MRIIAAIVTIILLSAVTVSAQSSGAASPDYFETKIRPILADNCFACHADSGLGGLRLDSREAMLKGGNRGPALVPGNEAKSLLITAVRQTDPGLKMPMGGKLKDSQIQELSEWVKAGGVWPEQISGKAPAASGKYVISAERKKFWSLLPLSAPAVPPVKDAKWSKTTIDKFVLANLEKQGLKPVGAASRHDLIRRATLDLTGLPPTPEEVAAFEKDKSPDAFVKVVDRLLASPHYGERWGRMWLDVARYGEDDYRSMNQKPRGFRPYPNAYSYRDWVIQSFNDDMPYDQFVTAQLAGDLLDPKLRYKTLPATGFLGLGPWFYDNGSNEITRADERHDRVDVVTRGFLGLTVACARCHDHKYDPIPQTDYYALAGIFFNTTYEEYPTAPKKVVDDYLKLEDERDMKANILKEENANLATQLSESLMYQTSNYLQGVYDISGPAKQDIAKVVEQRKLDFEVLDRWVKYMAKPTNKYKYKDAWLAMIKKGGTAAEAKRLADKFQQDVVSVELAKRDLDAQNKVITDKDIDGTKPKKRTDKPSNFVSNKDFNPTLNLSLLVLPEEQNNFYLEIFVHELREADDPNTMGEELAKRPGGVLTFKGWALQRRVGPESVARLKTMQDDLDAANKRLESQYPFIHGVKDSPNPVNIQLALRGNPENLGPEVQRHFLSVFAKGDNPEPISTGSGRLELAKDIVAQPLAMRVIVNRIWKGHFDTGIVDTPSNFGQMGERPTNPELLEYLASSFAANGMSIKKLHREIMLSSVYQLSTQNDEASFAKDSGNRLYWRFNKHRLDAEQLRDSVLAAAGNLDDSMGGPSEELTPSLKRRTVYGKVSRYKTDTYLETFDFPSPSISAEKRFTTTVPLQRLFLMNSDFMQLEAEELAKRVTGEADDRARIRKLYELTFARVPTEQEVKVGVEYLRTEPLKEYEESKGKSVKADAGTSLGGSGVEAPAVGEAATAPVAETPATPPEPEMGMGMMDGVMTSAKGDRAAGTVKYEATVWGRYAKALLSSSEFLLIN